ncbi:unnamed protein product [Sphagnum jensenii]|uniref:Uncharacterized protein n=1 Tax=Sphagnum jensenii TaxID=128206 RepID=A0ABP0X9Y3_9BRYO
MGGILSLLLLLCMVFSGSVLARQQARDSVLARQQERDSVLARQQERDSVLARQQEQDSVARKMLDPWRLVSCQEALWVDDDAQPTDIPRREWKGKSSVAEVNSRCTKQEEAGTVKASDARAETLAMEEDSFRGFALRRLFHYDFSVGFGVQPSSDSSPNMPNQWMAIRIFPFFSFTYLFARSVTWNWSNLTIKILLANVVCN